ncbi:MAG: hypothetical protein KJ002_08955, partial [Candidatus Dadabacteria bacterium]|nr:hypothetical protein [Candidatus Dadabacteria bacterium]
LKEILSSITNALKPDARVIRGMVLRAVILLSVLVLASLTASLGFAFLVWSLFLYLGTMFEPHVAALISGAIAILLAVILVGAALLVMGFLNGSRKKRKVVSASAEGPSGASEVDLALALVRQYPLESGLTAAVVGFIAGSSPDARKTMAEFLMTYKGSGPNR